MITNREQIGAIIRGSQVCRLALTMEDSPYLVPMSFGYDGTAIFLHTARAGKKIEYFEANNRVCFEFERNVSPLLDREKPCKSDFAFESVIGFGTIHELVKPEEKQYAIRQIVQQYSGEKQGFDGTVPGGVRVWKISVDSVTGRRSPTEDK